MASRIQLNNELEELLGSDHVYFQPPATVKMAYPCIRYTLEADRVDHADDISYNRTHRYSVIVIDKDPDRLIYERLIKHFQYCRLSRVYCAENLNHYVLELYY